MEELEAALDSLDGIAPDGGELDSENIAREARIRDAYLKWCKEFRKQPDESRFPTFSNNFLLMEQYAKETNKEMNLNQYADCTKEEYEEMQQKQVVSPAEVLDEADEAKARREQEEANRRANEYAEKENAKARELRAKELAERAKLEAERRKQIDQEKADRLKKQEADLARQQAALEASVIAAAKADAERQAKLAAQRAKVEAEAAALARKQAKEWDEKQRKLATGSRSVLKTTKKPSFFDVFKSEPPKAPAPKKVSTTILPKTKAAPNAFSFFTSPFAEPKKASILPVPPKTSPPITVKKTEPSFSFFKSAPTSPSVVKKSDSTPAPFSFFNNPRKEPVVTKVAAKVEPKKDIKVPNKLGSISLFGSGAAVPKSSPSQTIVPPNFPGSISLKPSSVKSTVASIPNRPGTISIKKASSPKPSPTFSLFTFPGTAPKASETAPATKVAVSKSKPSPTLSIFSSFSSPNAPTTPNVKGSTEKPSGTFSIFGSQTSSKSGSKVVPPKQQVKPSPSFSVSLFGNNGASTAQKVPPKNMPILSQWKQNPDGSVTGKVSNSPNFKTGTQITTSPVPKGAKAGSIVKTGSGSQYFLR